MFTTLNKIRERSPCACGWVKLLKHLGKHDPDDEPLSFATILQSNGMDDAIWCLRTLDDQKPIVLFALGCARGVEHLLSDERSKAALRTVEVWLEGRSSKEEVEAAWAAAADAAARAAEAARAAAADAAWAAAWAAVVAAWAAADAADAAWRAARAAEWAARAAERAARAAEWAARVDAKEVVFAEILELQRTLFLDIFGKD